MDIANHILSEIKKLTDQEYSQEAIQEVFGELGEIPELHYLFLDEVQDLPSGIIFLISKIFKNGVYYSGDTAQAIQKGIIFKFSNINEMFR